MYFQFPCSQCGKKSQIVMQWIDGGSLVIKATGEPQQRIASRFILCLWCLRREEQEMDPENIDHFRTVATIPGQGMAGALPAAPKEEG